MLLSRVLTGATVLCGLLLNHVHADSISDIQHIVIFMQENRPLDHYYGLLSGVRGYDDRTVPRSPLISNHSLWYQAIDSNSTHYQLPYHVDTLRTSATCMDAPDMGYEVDIKMWNHGRMDQWNTARPAGYGMSYFNRTDLPYYYALADSFTIGDQYFQSTFTQTNPNRLFLFSGCNGLSQGYPAVVDNDETHPHEWLTVAEVLEQNNVTWKVYQELDNFDDNAFAWFKTFQQAQPGSPLWDQGRAIVPDLVQAFEQDMAAGTLPQVSWIIAPTALSEHATNHPAAGEDLSARLIAVLQANPQIYKNTAFILNYDEGGQFFDHHWTPTPPVSDDDGKSTVSTKGEIWHTADGKPSPIGLGFRVPLIVISPWTRGGHVVSEVFDHTSVIQFVETRFGVHVPTISDWRRTVCGDLTSAFDFSSADYTWPQFPSTVGYVNEANWQCWLLPRPKIPKEQHMPTQEPGVRPARRLPYSFLITDEIQNMSLIMSINNMGTRGAAFQLYDHTCHGCIPKKYTVGAGHILSDTISAWKLNETYIYDADLHGPNGFVRRMIGVATDDVTCLVISSYDTHQKQFILTLQNTRPNHAQPCAFTINDMVYHQVSKSIIVNGGSTVAYPINVSDSGNWYDVSVTHDDPADPLFLRRYMGRIEVDGSTTDPAKGNALNPDDSTTQHPENPDWIRAHAMKYELKVEDFHVTNMTHNKDALYTWKPTQMDMLAHN